MTASGRLLRPLDAGDGPALVAVTDHPGVTAAISFMPTPFTLADAAALIERQAGGRDVFLGIREAGALVGVVGCHLDGEAAIEIGYWIAPDRWGRGVALDAAARAVAWAHRQEPLRQIFAECHPLNRASGRILARLGFHPAGDGRRAGRERLVWTPGKPSAGP